MLTLDHVEAPVLASMPLGKRSVVVVAGAYKGDTCEFLLNKFGCIIHAYEPQKWALAQVVADMNVIKHPFALGLRNQEVTLYEYETDACSVLPIASRSDGTGRMMDALVELRRLVVDYGKIDLLLLNVEGYEYFLLPYIHSVPIGALMVQMHHYKGDAPYSHMFGTLIEMLCSKYGTVEEVGKGWFYCHA
jgi:FkbM family methyltransferase